MSRLGWAVALFLVLLGSALAAMVRVVPARAPAEAAPQAVVPPTVVAAAPRPAGPVSPVLPLPVAPLPAPAPATAMVALPASPALVVPVQGVARASLRSNWGDPRGGGTRTHTGLDIMAPGGTPVLAAADGTIEKLFESHGGGGTTVYERSNDRRWIYYYAHLSGYAPGLHEGQAVRAGETIAFVGDTGNAGPGNYHLHFGISVMQPGDRWHQGTPIDPYPLLAAGGSGG